MQSPAEERISNLQIRDDASMDSTLDERSTMYVPVSSGENRIVTLDACLRFAGVITPEYRTTQGIGLYTS